MTKHFLPLVSCALFVAFIVPLSVSAHAVPTAYIPDSSTVVDSVPQSISITFSEHVDAFASSLQVKGPSGATVSSGKPQVSAQDGKTLSIPLTADGNGTYLVSWSVVSADDGHFTKGSYPFAVGTGTVIPSTAEASSEVVEIATTPEALGMSVELAGNGLVWALLVLFAFAIRPLLQTGKYGNEERTIQRGYWLVILSAIVLALSGAAWQLYVKSSELAGLQSVSFTAAFLSYIGTAAGSATLWRMGAVVLVAVLFFIGRKKIFTASKITLYEWGMALAMCVFAFMRAKISHATANPFFPDFSIAVNFVHLIEKDIWAGIIGILVLVALSPRLRHFLHDLVPKAFTLVSLDFAAVTVTACYIIWLHLKSFNNVFTTQWGNALLVLLLAAVLLVGARLYHVFARRYRPDWFSKALPATLAIEFALGLLVIYASSVIIITSPPLEVPQAKSFSANDQHVSITLTRDPLEDGMGLITLTGAPASSTPALIATDESNTANTFSIDLSKRFVGGYVFPLSFLAGTGPYDLQLTVPNPDGYDAHASFTIPHGAFDLPQDAGAHRSFDFFTLSMIAIAIIGLIFALLVLRFSDTTSHVSFVPSSKSLPRLYTFGAFLIAMYAGAFLMTTLSSSPLANPFKAQCVGDGNMWHLMLPTKAGVAVSSVPQEGCMWGMGNFMYQFADKREYDYEQSLGKAEVSLATRPSTLSTGVPTTLTFTVKNADGSPATLFVDMEKLIHIVIVSEDQTVFAHIHPDDIHPLTAKDIAHSTFSVNYTFPKAGRYLVSADFAHGLILESKQFTVAVSGGPIESAQPAKYPSKGTFGGYQVLLDPGLPFAGQVNTMRYTITKDGKPVTNLEQYLSAAMHVSVVKNDFSAFVHVHGEVHSPGAPYPPILVKNGQVVHSMAMMTLPDRFGPTVESHLIFPSAGTYTIWGEFKVEGKVIPTAFTVNVEQ